MDDRTLSFASMLARIRELEIALQPFAKAGRGYMTRVPQTRLVSTATGDITVSDLIAAVRAIEGE